MINSFLEERASNAQKALLFFYCNGNFQETRDTSYIIGSILKQLFSSVSLEMESPAYARLEDLPTSSMAVSEMVKTIRWLSRFFVHVTIVADGIDECDDPERLCDTLKTLTSGNIRVLAISRPERDIHTALSGLSNFEMNDSLNQADIVTYIHCRLERDVSLRCIRPDLKVHIKERLFKECGGMYRAFNLTYLTCSFRWVQCQLDHLSSLDRDSARRQALENLPLGLAETYRRIMDKLSQHKDRFEISMRALMWLFFSVRPLSLHELAVAAVIDPSEDFNEEQNLDTDELILTYCHSFIKFNRYNNFVEVAHISVTQFFTSSSLNDGSPNPYFLDQKIGDLIILKACFMWLKSSPFMNQNPYDLELPQVCNNFSTGLTLYSVYNWPEHGKKARWSKEGCSDIIAFLNNDQITMCGLLWAASEDAGLLRWGMTPDQWQEVDEQMARETLLDEILTDFNITSWLRPPSKCSRALYYSALLGFDNVVEELMNQGAGPSLYEVLAAGQKQHWRVFRQLIADEGEPDLPEDIYRNMVVLLALDLREWQIASNLLFLWDVGPSEWDLSVWLCPLETAVRAWTQADDDKAIKKDDNLLRLMRLGQVGCYETVFNLLDFWRVDPNKSRLLCFVGQQSREYLGLANLLIEYGADPRLSDASGKTASELARENGHSDLAEVLEAWPDNEPVFKKILERRTLKGKEN